MTTTKAAKYILLQAYDGVDVYPEKGKIELSKNTSQSQLKYLYEQGHQGVRKVGDDPVKDDSEAKDN